MKERNLALSNCRCYSCGTLLDGASDALETDAQPKPGDLSMCVKCGVLGVFYGPANDLRMRAPQLDELSNLDQSTKRGLEIARSFIRRRMN